MVFFLKICAENLNALCPETSVKELNGLENQTTKAAKKIKKSDQRCMVDDDNSGCDCERFRGDFTALKSTYQERHRLAYDDIHIVIEEEIQSNPKSFFKVC
jgi:hypothetical protein